jgi:hypothetical protein
MAKLRGLAVGLAMFAAGLWLFSSLNSLRLGLLHEKEVLLVAAVALGTGWLAAQGSSARPATWTRVWLAAAAVLFWTAVAVAAFARSSFTLLPPAGWVLLAVVGWLGTTWWLSRDSRLPVGPPPP